MKKKFLFILFSFVLMISFISCSKKEDKKVPKVKEIGEVKTKDDVKSKIEKEEKETIEETVENILNPKRNFEKGGSHEKESLVSYYKRNSLDDKEQIIYDEIYQSIEDYQTNIILNKPITVDQSKKIMNIIFLDTPEFFHIERRYAYKTTVDEKVESILVYYIMSEEDYKKYKEEIVLNNTSLIKSIRNSNSYDALNDVISSIKNVKYSTDNSVSKDTERFKEKEYPFNSTYSIFGLIYTDKVDSFGVANYINYMLRKGGVESTIKLGVLSVDDPLTDYGYDVPNHKKYKNGNLYKEYKINKENHVELNLSGLYAFNTIKLTDNNWYNYDYFMGEFLSNKFYKTLDENKRNGYEMNLLSVCSDYFISQTRSFYMNEQILGITPLCDSNEFMNSYREKKLLPNIPRSKMLMVQNKIISNFVKEDSNIVYQFSDYETYDNFIKNIRNAFDFYNKNNENVIESYKIHTDPKTLTIGLYDLVKY